MQRFWKLAPWLIRLVLLLPIALFAQIGISHAFHPVQTLAARGISFGSGFGITTARIGFGAFPFGLSIFLLGCVLAESRLLIGLSLVATMDAVILVSRIVAMNIDASVRDNMKLVDAEVILLVIIGAGIFLELSRRTRIHPHRERVEQHQKEVLSAQQSSPHAKLSAWG